MIPESSAAAHSSSARFPTQGRAEDPVTLLTVRVLSRRAYQPHHCRVGASFFAARARPSRLLADPLFQLANAISLSLALLGLPCIDEVLSWKPNIRTIPNLCKETKDSEERSREEDNKRGNYMTPTHCCDIAWSTCRMYEVQLKLNLDRNLRLKMEVVVFDRAFLAVKHCIAVAFTDAHKRRGPWNDKGTSTERMGARNTIHGSFRATISF